MQVQQTLGSERECHRSRYPSSSTGLQACGQDRRLARRAHEQGWSLLPGALDTTDHSPSRNSRPGFLICSSSLLGPLQGPSKCECFPKSVPGLSFLFLSSTG